MGIVLLVGSVQKGLTILSPAAIYGVSALKSQLDEMP